MPRDDRRRLRAFGSIPLRGPVEGAQEGARRDRGVGRMKRPLGDSLRDEGPDAALVSIAFGHDRLAQFGWQRVDFKVRRRSFDLVDQAEHV